MKIEIVDGLPPEFAARIAPLFAGSEWLGIADDLREGRAELFSINGGESICATRFEVADDWKELVVLAYEGRALREFARLLVQVAIDNGADSLRYHTKRHGMSRLLGEFGPVEKEIIYTVDLHGRH